MNDNSSFTSGVAIVFLILLCCSLSLSASSLLGMTNTTTPSTPLQEEGKK